MANAPADTSLTSGGLFVKMVKFTIPVMLTGILQLIYNAADIIVVGRFAGTIPQSAVGSTTALVHLLVNLFIGLSVGVSVVLSNYLGAKDDKSAQETVNTGLAVAVVLGLIATVIGLVASPTLLQWMQTPENVIDKSILYLRIFFLGMPCNMVANFGFAILRASGDAKRPLQYLGIAGLVNVGLNLLLVAVFHLDVAGVAIATITAQTLCALWVVRNLMQRTDALQFIPKQWKVYPHKVKQIVRIGLPAGVQSTLFSLSNVVLQSTVNSFGDVTMAADANAGTIVGFLYLAITAVQQTITVFTSQNLGAKAYKRVHKTLGYSACLSVSIAVVTSTFVYFAAPTILSWYNTDPEVVAIGVMKLRLVTPLYFIFGLSDMLGGFLRGMGYSIIPTLVSMCGICLLRIVWVVAVFPTNPTLQCLYLSYPVTWIVTLSALVYASVWALRRMPKESPLQP